MTMMERKRHISLIFCPNCNELLELHAKVRSYKVKR